MSTDKYRIHGLEFNLSHTCNLRCEHCDHLSPYYLNDSDPNGKISLESFREWITQLARSIEVEDFLLIGGEPLLNKEYGLFADVVARSGLAKNLCLVTNGFLLPKQNPETLKKFQVISVMDYSSKPLPVETKEWIRNFCETHSIRYSINPSAQFHKSFVGKKLPNFLARMLFMTCPLTWRQRCYTLYDGMLCRCSRIPFISHRLHALGMIDEEFSAKDSLVIDGEDDFGARARAYFEARRPLESCNYCLGGVSKPYPHRQLTMEEVRRESWREDRSVLNSVYFSRLVGKYVKVSLGLYPKGWLRSGRS